MNTTADNAHLIRIAAIKSFPWDLISIFPFLSCKRIPALFFQIGKEVVNNQFVFGKSCVLYILLSPLFRNLLSRNKGFHQFKNWMEDVQSNNDKGEVKERFPSKEHILLFQWMVKKNPVLLNLVRQFDLVDSHSGKAFPMDCC